MSLAAPQPLVPGFLVVHSNLPEQLRALLVHWVKAYPLSVLETETILVQSNGIAQWLRLALASDVNAEDATLGGAGIAAGLSLQMPGRFIWQLYRWVLPADAIPEQSVFDKSQLRWRLMRLLPELAKQADFAVFADYLSGDQTQDKLQQLAFKLADLFDQYQVYRADWLQAWAQGHDWLLDGQGQQVVLATDQQWQSALWRAIIADVPAQQQHYSRAELHQRFLQAAARFDGSHRPAGLPRRVLVFGVSSLPQQVLEALAAIAPYTQILLAVHNPSRHYWADIITEKDLLSAQWRRQQPKPSAGIPSGGSVSQHGHPLLAAWGKQGKDYIRVLDAFDQTHQHRQLFVGERIDLFTEQSPTHLLAQLQSDILELRPALESKALWPALTATTAASLCFVCAHSALREIEILHDDLLAQFAADPQLTPADVMVMVPDIHQYSAAISAVFGRFNSDDPRFIPFTIADQAATEQEPILPALQMLLSLRTQRFEVSAVLDLLQLPALQARFGFSEADLPVLKHWIDAAQIRWGLDAEQRQSLGLNIEFAQNSWLHGIERMLLGYAMGDSPQHWQGIAPCAAVSGLSAALAGQLYQLFSLLQQYWQQSAMLLTASEWRDWLLQLLRDFFQPNSQQEQTLFAQLQQALQTWFEQCRDAEMDLPLQLSVVAKGWLEPFAATGLSQRFLAGAVNFATLMPMRAIPFAQIHLLGMNDGQFPRQVAKQDFDLMQLCPRAGDRSRREDDRYLFLEALLSARQRLRISWIGRSVHDNSERAPSVLVGQLRDHLAAVWRFQQGEQLLTGDALLEQLTTEHPLQPFSRRYLQANSALQSYQHEWLAMHASEQQAASFAQPARLHLPEQLPVWDLERLVSWLKDPVRFFFRQRLKVQLDVSERQSLDTEDFELDGLTRWKLQARLQQKLMAAIDQSSDWSTLLPYYCQQMQAEGVLPVGAAGQLVQQQLIEIFSPQAAHYASWLKQAPTTVVPAIRCQFHHDGLQLGDWLKQCRQQSDGSLVCFEWLVGALYKDKQLDLRHLFRPWFKQLLASANGHVLSIHGMAVDAQFILPPLSQAAAEAELRQLGIWLLDSLSRPLPIELGCAKLLLAEELDAAAPLDPKLWSKLAQYYCGDGYRDGVLHRHRELARAFPDFQALWQEGELLTVSKALYQGLMRYLQQVTIQELSA